MYMQRDTDLLSSMAEFSLDAEVSLSTLSEVSGSLTCWTGRAVVPVLTGIVCVCLCQV